MIDFAEIRSTAQAHLKNILARVAFGGTTGDGDAGAQVVPDASADEAEDGAEVWQQWGFASRPRPSAGVVEALVVPLEDGLVVLATRQQRTQIALAEGEVVLFNGTGATIRLAANGDVQITPAEGCKVVLAGGLLDAARATDPVSVSIPIGAVHITNPMGTPPTIPNPAAIPLTGTITTGNPYVKA